MTNKYKKGDEVLFYRYSELEMGTIVRVFEYWGEIFYLIKCEKFTCYSKESNVSQLIARKQ
jgi:hypothetical protein